MPQGLRGVHDPALIEADGRWILFGTGPGIQIRCGSDLTAFELCSRVFFGRPAWHRETVPGVDHLWAPDISEHEGEVQHYPQTFSPDGEGLLFLTDAGKCYLKRVYEIPMGSRATNRSSPSEIAKANMPSS